MSREFDDGGSQYLISGAQSIIVDNTDLPVTMACWFKSDSLTVTQALMNVIDYSSNHYLVLYAAGSVDDKIWAVQYDGVNSGQAKSSTTYSANTWHHACGVFKNQANRSVYIDGGSKVTNTTNCPNQADMDRFAIGGLVYNGGGSTVFFVSGAVAEAAIWKAELSDSEVAAIAHGFSPLMVKPESLEVYWPLIRDTDIDIVGGYDLTDHNGPTVSGHMPKLMYPSAKSGYFPTLPSSIPPAHAAPAIDSAVIIS